MEKMNFVMSRIPRRFTGCMGFLLLSTLLLCTCAHQKPQLSASQYRFDFKGKSYRLRSIFSQDKTASHNELVGENFVAADLDQDRILDCILLGETSLDEAQKIYEHGLNLVARENKLHVRIPGANRYTQESNGLILEIISFRPANAPPFNEFKIIDNRCPQFIIAIDQAADGVLDKVLQGAMALDEVQPRYAETIEDGLRKGKLLKAGHAILVKEK